LFEAEGNSGVLFRGKGWERVRVRLGPLETLKNR
jgi:hypothetical protein